MKNVTEIRQSSKVKAYLASPFFTPTQISDEELIYQSYSQYWDVFRPCSTEASKKFCESLNDFERRSLGDVIYQENLQNIESSDVVLVNSTGFDSGTMFELGYAIGLGKRVMPASASNDERAKLSRIIGEFSGDICNLGDLNTPKMVSIKCCEPGGIICKDSKSWTVLAEGFTFTSKETSEGCTNYEGKSKILLGYLTAKGKRCCYVDLNRKSNIMLTRAATVVTFDCCTELSEYDIYKHGKINIGNLQEE